MNSPRRRQKEPSRNRARVRWVYLPLPALLDDRGNAISERHLTLAAQHHFERHPGGTGDRQLVLPPAADCAIAGDQQRPGHRWLRQPKRFAATMEEGGFGHCRRLPGAQELSCFLCDRVRAGRVIVWRVQDSRPRSARSSEVSRTPACCAAPYAADLVRKARAYCASRVVYSLQPRILPRQSLPVTISRSSAKTLIWQLYSTSPSPKTCGPRCCVDQM